MCCIVYEENAIQKPSEANLHMTFTAKQTLQFGQDNIKGGSSQRLLYSVSTHGSAWKEGWSFHDRFCKTEKLVDLA
eukprot:555834-Amphidinium_carterae.1